LLDRAPAAPAALVASVEGVPGIGKSALLAEVADEARRRGHQVVGLACHELHGDRPFGAWLSATLPPGLPELRATIDSIETHPISAEALAAAWLRSRAVDALVNEMIRVASRRPVAVLIDDLQWADASTISTVDALLSSRSAAHVTVIVALRPPPYRPAVRAFRHGLHARSSLELELEPLDLPAATVLATTLAGAPPGPNLSRLVDGAGGSPILITELLRSMKDEGRLVIAGGIAEVDAPRAAPSLHAALVRRLDYLPEATFVALRTASLFGAPFSLAELAQAMDVSTFSLAAHLEPALRSGIIVPRGDRLDFGHDLIREALYEGLSDAARSSLHRALGLALADIGAEPTVVASHLSIGATSGDESAIDWLRRAGRRVMSTAPSTGVDLLERAAGIVRPDQEVAPLVAADRVDALVAAGRIDKAEEVARAAITELPTGPGSWRPHQALAEVLHWTDRFPEAASHLQIALAMNTVDRPARGRMLAVMADALAAEGRFDEARHAASKALNAASRADAFARWMANDALAFERFLSGHIAQTVPFARKALAAAEPMGPRGAWFAVPEEARYFHHADLHDEAEAMLTAAIQDSARAAWPTDMIHRQLAAVYFGTGRWRSMLASFAASEEASMPGGDDRRLSARRPAIIIDVARVAIGQGDLIRASHWLEVSRRSGNAERMAHLVAWTEAAVADARGDNAGAIAALENGIRAAERRGFLAHYRQLGWDVVTIALRAGRRDLATLVTARLEELAQRASVRSIDGLASTCRGLLEADLERCQEGVAAYRESPRRYEQARACETLGHLAVVKHAPDVAAKAFAEAIAIYDACPASADAARARKGLRDLGVRPAYRRSRRTRARAGWEALTRSEQGVIRLAAEGLTNGQIAHRLFVSKRTVETHMSHGYAKLGATSRVELARIVIAQSSSPPATGAE
jgi:DNA-binding CsgD family transcriptional regulator